MQRWAVPPNWSLEQNHSYRVGLVAAPVAQRDMSGERLEQCFVPLKIKASQHEQPQHCAPEDQ